MAQSTRRGSVWRLLSGALVIAILMPLLLVSGPNTASAATQSTLTQYRQWMAQAKALYPYPQTLDKMYRVMMCESSGNRYASGWRARYLGLYQYAPSTWRGIWNPYRNYSMWDARAQIFATAKAWSIGMQRQWSCYYITAGR